jgi:hypothetical protein
MLQKFMRRQRLLVIVGLLALMALSYGVYQVAAAETEHKFTGTVIDNAKPVEGVELTRAGSEKISFQDAWQGKTLLVFSVTLTALTSVL